MTTTIRSFTDLSDRDLLAEVKRLAEDERQATARLVASLAEVDERRLYLGEGCSCLFTYCVRVLHLSEHAAYNRIEAARAARRFPLVLERLADGSIHLTGIRLLAPTLTPGNHRALLDTARHKSKREIEHLIAQLEPRPDVPATVRKLPTPAVRGPITDPSPAALPADAEPVAPQPAFPPPPPVRPAVVSPLSPERYRVQFTVSKGTHDKLRRVQDLMRHRVPNGDPAVIFDRALTALLAELERTKLAAVKRPRARAAVSAASRHVPAAVKRAVWARDAGQCAFVGTRGRCSETGFLEFHHIVPYAAGGETSVANMELRCRAHNAYEAEKYFGTGSLFVRERRCGAWARGGLVPGLLCQIAEQRRKAVRSGKLTLARKNAPSAPRVATRAGSPTLRGSHAAGAFYLIRIAPAHACLREPHPAWRESDKVAPERAAGNGSLFAAHPEPTRDDSSGAACRRGEVSWRNGPAARRTGKLAGTVELRCSAIQSALLAVVVGTAESVWPGGSSVPRSECAAFAASALTSEGYLAASTRVRAGMSRADL